MTNVLIGAGGHGKLIYEVAKTTGVSFSAFVDPKVTKFFSIKKLDGDDFFSSFFLGLGGANVEQLEKRHRLFSEYKKRAESIAPIISPQAFVAQSAVIGRGSFVNTGAIVQSFAKIGENVIINSGVIVEHDAVIEDGVHVAPGAIILGGSYIKSTSMVGSGAVILPGRVVCKSTLVPSLTRL